MNILKTAQDKKYAVGAFNVSGMEQIKAIVSAAQKLNSPVIISTSEGESAFAGLKQIRAVVSVWQKETGLPLVLHLDHGKSLAKIKEAIEAGYDSVQFDGTTLSFEENIEETKKIVELAHSQNVVVEGELGFLPGSSTLHEEIEIKEEDLTKVEEAVKFVQETQVDSLAVIIGNTHGMAAQEPRLFLDRLAAIKEKVNLPLVLHGGSGIVSEDIRQAIELGICKINVNTELRLAFTQGLRKFIEENPKETTPYKIMPAVIEAVQKVVEEKIKLFGSKI